MGGPGRARQGIAPSSSPVESGVSITSLISPITLVKRLFALDRDGSVARRLAPEVQLTRMPIRMPGLPGALDGFRIVQISDLHVGAFHASPVHPGQADRLVEKARPDLLVITGDFLAGTPPLETVLDVVRRLMPGERDGAQVPTIAILGNHDYYAGRDVVHALITGLRSIGVTVLTNETTCIAVADETLVVAGLTGEEPGMEETVRKLAGREAPRLLLIHEPDLAERLPPGCASLILAGHTHGGQIALPGLEPVISRVFCGSRYVAGWYRVQGMPLYVNRGLGMIGIPIRFRAAPEVTCFELVR